MFTVSTVLSIGMFTTAIAAFSSADSAPTLAKLETMLNIGLASGGLGIVLLVVALAVAVKEDNEA